MLIVFEIRSVMYSFKLYITSLPLAQPHELYMSQRDEYCTQHGEYQCLNVAYQYFEEHHKGTHRNTYYCHTRTCHIVGDSISSLMLNIMKMIAANARAIA